MRRFIHLDFLRTRPAHVGRTWVLASLALVGLLMCIGAAVSQARQAAALDREIEQARRVLGSGAPGRRAVAVAVEPQHLAAQLKQANDALDRLATPWPRLFAALEGAADPRVVLVGLQPEEKGRRVRIAGVARRYEDVLDYVGRLQETQSLSDVFLASHETRDEPSGPTIAFTLTADWRELAR